MLEKKQRFRREKPRFHQTKVAEIDSKRLCRVHKLWRGGKKWAYVRRRRGGSSEISRHAFQGSDGKGLSISSLC